MPCTTLKPPRPKRLRLLTFKSQRFYVHHITLPYHLSKLEDIQVEMDIRVALLLPNVLPFGIDILNLGLVLSRRANL